MLNNGVKPKITVGVIGKSPCFCTTLQNTFEEMHSESDKLIIDLESTHSASKSIAEILVVDLDNIQPDQQFWLKSIVREPQTHVIVLSTSSKPEEIVESYTQGVDDYIIKPCSHQEVAFRIEVLIRRFTWSAMRKQPNSRFPEMVHWVSDVLHGDAQDCLIRLNPIEWQLLTIFMHKPNEVIPSEKLFREAWGYEVRGFQTLLELAIRHLQQKIQLASPTPWSIQAVGASGYKLQLLEPLPEPDSTQLPTYTYSTV